MGECHWVTVGKDILNQNTERALILVTMKKTCASELHLEAAVLAWTQTILRFMVFLSSSRAGRVCCFSPQTHISHSLQFIIHYYPNIQFFLTWITYKCHYVVNKYITHLWQDGRRQSTVRSKKRNPSMISMLSWKSLECMMSISSRLVT